MIMCIIYEPRVITTAYTITSTMLLQRRVGCQKDISAPPASSPIEVSYFAGRQYFFNLKRFTMRRVSDRACRSRTYCRMMEMNMPKMPPLTRLIIILDAPHYHAALPDGARLFAAPVKQRFAYAQRAPYARAHDFLRCWPMNGYGALLARVSRSPCKRYSSTPVYRHQRIDAAFEDTPAHIYMLFVGHETIVRRACLRFAASPISSSGCHQAPPYSFRAMAVDCSILTGAPPRLYRPAHGNVRQCSRAADIFRFLLSYMEDSDKQTQNSFYFHAYI